MFVLQQNTLFDRTINFKHLKIWFLIIKKKFQKLESNKIHH